jgi:wyosine [tRNA(Phe)-imidazoG37] synthetase (radical SAM superfamily)
MSCIFGPVPSRRLGRSLGVDLVPFKTCSYDCIYCQLGRTTNKTVAKSCSIPPSVVLAELKEKLSCCEPDYITLSGSGEPTLYSHIPELIDGIKALTSVPVAILTNGSMLHEYSVRCQLLKADLVIPSLDAGNEQMFQAVNRPYQSLSFEKILNGLIEFKNEFKGKYWLEVFLLGGYTAIEAEVRKIAHCVRRIKPDKVQLNTVTRPPAEDYAIPVTRTALEKFVSLFGVPTEIIADFRQVHQQKDFQLSRENVLELLQRRPCTIEDIAGGLGMHINEAIKYVEELNAEKLITKTLVSGKMYFKATENMR